MNEVDLSSVIIDLPLSKPSQYTSKGGVGREGSVWGREYLNTLTQCSLCKFMVIRNMCVHDICIGCILITSIQILSGYPRYQTLH